MNATRARARRLRGATRYDRRTTSIRREITPPRALSSLPPLPQYLFHPLFLSFSFSLVVMFHRERVETADSSPYFFGLIETEGVHNPAIPRISFIDR